MRTKVLLCAAALAASLASSWAQVYSLNVVGYYNVTVPAHGYFMIANQLNTTNNMLSALIPAPTDGSGFFKYAGGYSAATFDALGGAWDKDFSLNPGEAGFFKDPTTGTGQVLTFVGEVLQGQLVNTIPSGVYCVRSSMVPQEGTLSGDLKVPADDGDGVFVFNGGWGANTYDGLAAAWDSPNPAGPTIKVGQGFFYHKTGTSTSWVRNFTVQ